MVRWRVHDERRIYDSPWIALALVTVEPPGVEPFEHHVVRAPAAAAGCVVTRGPFGPDQEVLLLYRHRFITDSWGWEIPAGGVEPGEDPVDTAVRESIEETGWHPTGTPTTLVVYHPSNGLSDQTFHIVHVDGAEHVGDPSDPSEASEVSWHRTEDVVGLLAEGRLGDGLSVTGLSTAFTLGVLYGARRR